MALAAQLAVIYSGFGAAEELRRFIFPASYALLLGFVALNWRSIGLLIIGAGMVLNLLPILANGGLMPISPSSLEEAGRGAELAKLELGDAVPESKNVLLEESETHLEFLSDRFVWDTSGPVSVFSIGDVVIAAGLGVLFVEFLLPILARSLSRDRPSLT